MECYHENKPGYSSPESTDTESMTNRLQVEAKHAVLLDYMCVWARTQLCFLVMPCQILSSATLCALTTHQKVKVVCLDVLHDCVRLNCAPVSHYILSSKYLKREG